MAVSRVLARTGRTDRAVCGVFNGKWNIWACFYIERIRICTIYSNGGPALTSVMISVSSFALYVVVIFILNVIF